MVNNGVKKSSGKIPQILITQPKPESEKSPYFELERKYNIQLTFYPFIKLEPIPAKEFRKQKIDIGNFSAIIFTSRNAIDHFFRMSEEMKISISQDNKYFCITEAVALYLQKFILYRKRKVFYGADGTNKSMFDVINKTRFAPAASRRPFRRRRIRARSSSRAASGKNGSRNLPRSTGSFSSTSIRSSSRQKSTRS